MSGNPISATAQPVTAIDDQKVEHYVGKILGDKPETVRAIWALLRPLNNDLRYFVAIYRRVIAIDPDNVARDMIEGTPTLTPLEVDVYARRLIRAPQNHRGLKSVTGQLPRPDCWLVLARVTEIRAGDHKAAAAVILFELKELS
jgi:hypothetical protein